MKAIAVYVMRGPIQAISTSAGFALIALLLIPVGWPLSYLSGAAVALVTLAQSMRHGLQTMLAASLLLALVTMLTLGTPAPALVFAVLVWIPALLFAQLLKQTASLANTLLAAVMLGVVVILGSYLWLDDPAAMWFEHISNTVLPQMKQAGLEIPDEAALAVSLKVISQILTGMAVTSLLFGQVMMLFIARWWQAVLFKPGGFRQEFHQLRFGTLAAGATIAIVLLAVVSSGLMAELALNLVMLLSMLFMFQGLAIGHALVDKFKLNQAWLVAMYVVIVFVMPYGLLLAATVGLIDNWLKLRVRFGGQAV